MKKIAIVYGALDTPLQKKAVSLLGELLLDYTFERTVCVPCGEEHRLAEYQLIYVGTKANNAYIAANSKDTPTAPEGYAIRVENGVVMIEGADDAGTVYGCMDFYNKYLTALEFPHDGLRYRVDPFRKALPDFHSTSAPGVKYRGIWTWGHVIYDWRGFLDNMVKLKMNTVVIWNDFAPINGREIVAYAHDCGIRVIWGFPWLWDVNCAAIDVENAMAALDGILEVYEKQYLPLGGDGIYFQSFTELDREDIGGVLIAEAVTSFVNAGAKKFLDKYPELELQFGLHANSVKNKLEYIQNVDPRVRIVWENCGSFPYSYIPNNVKDFDKTQDFVRKIAALRGENDRFGLVTKGLVKLDWLSFTHLEGPVEIGISSEWMKKNRIENKNRIWRYIQSYWLTSAPYAHEAVRTFTNAKRGDLYCTALVEDGMFERNIMYPVALYAEMLWEPDGDTAALMNEVGLRGYVSFA